MPRPDHPRRGFLVGLAALPLTGAVTSAKAAFGADAERIELGRQLDAAWAKKRRVAAAMHGRRDAQADAACDTAWQRVDALLPLIERLSATTLDGLKVKARACSWCLSGDRFEDDSLNEQARTDVRFAAGILRALMAMQMAGGGRPA